MSEGDGGKRSAASHVPKPQASRPAAAAKPAPAADTAAGKRAPVVQISFEGDTAVLHKQLTALAAHAAEISQVVQLTAQTLGGVCAPLPLRLP
jgi:hypothetical protein